MTFSNFTKANGGQLCEFYNIILFVLTTQYKCTEIESLINQLNFDGVIIFSLLIENDVAADRTQ